MFELNEIKLYTLSQYETINYFPDFENSLFSLHYKCSKGMMFVMSITINDFLQSMSKQPHILFLGQDFDVKAPYNKQILNLEWSCVYTSKTESAVSSAFNNSARMTRNIDQKDQLHGNILDKKNLKIVRLFRDEDHKETLSSRTEQNNAFMMLSEIPTILAGLGVLVVVGYTPQDRLSIDKMCDLLSIMREGSVIFFDEAEQLSPTEIREISLDKKFFLLPNSIATFLLPYLGDEENEEELDYSDRDPERSYFYVNQKTESLNKRDLFEVSRIVKLLTIEEIDAIQVPPYLQENYFYNFLKESAFYPQWYGYQNGFHLERNFENILLKKVGQCLEHPGNEDLKPIGLFGQSGSGKSIAMGYLAYKVFEQRKFPVIYINNRDLTFSSEAYKMQDTTIQQIKSSQFVALNDLLDKLKRLEAEATLIIWDLSAATKQDHEKCLKLFSLLRSRGHNVQLVFTSYFSDQIWRDFTKNRDAWKSESKALVNWFEADLRLSETEENHKANEVKLLREILKNKAHFSVQDIEKITEKISQSSEISSSFMALLYMVFYEVRRPLEQGIKREAITTICGITDMILHEQPEAGITTMAHAFRRILPEAELKQLNNLNIRKLEQSINNLLITTAICSKFNLDLPSDLAHRLLDYENYFVFTNITNIPFFDLRDTEYGDYVFRIRTKLEAEMLLRSYGVTTEMEVERISNMIGLIRCSGQYNHENEVNLIVSLLFQIGPNVVPVGANKEYAEYYNKIINALQLFRDETGGSPRLTLQEIVYMREYGHSVFADSPKKPEDVERYIQILQEAIRIGELEKNKLIRYSYNVNMCNRLTIEVSNSRIQLCKHLPGNLMECRRAQEDAMSVLENNPDSPYA